MFSPSIQRKFWAAFSILFFVVAAAWLSHSLRAEDQPKQPKKPANDSKAGEAKANDDKSDETPEEAAKRIASLAARGGDLENYEAEKAKFLAKYPDHAARWDFKMLDAQLPLQAAKSREEFEAAMTKIKANLAEIVSAKDAPGAIREQASMMSIQLGMRGASPDELTKLVSDHIKQFPESKGNGRLAMMLVSTVSRGDPEKTLPVVEKLAASDLKPIAEAAKEKLEQIKTLLELKVKPMELKFTAVDGREVDLTGHRGKVVLIDYWATWCGPCVAGLPEVIDLYGKYHDKGLEIVGISFDQDKDALVKFVEKKEMAWAQYFDGKGWQNEYGRKYGINGIPTMWLIGKDGKVVDFEARQDLAEKLAKLLKEEPKE